MIKHLPEGLTPFKDCGFARHPLYPMEHQPFTVSCRVDESVETPSLLVSVDGIWSAPLAPSEQNGASYTFALGGYPFNARVAYAFKTNTETTPAFDVPICREETYSAPLRLSMEEKRARLDFQDGVSLSFEAGETLTMRCAFDGQADMPPTERAVLVLPGHFSFVCTASPFICELKRFSKTVLALSSLRVLRDRTGARCVTQRWTWCPKHVWGTGERFDAVDQLGRGTNGRVVEKFTEQGEQSYIPMPFFMTDAGFGWYRHGAVPAAMRFSDTLCIEQALGEGRETVDELLFGRPSALLAQYIEKTGKPVLPPQWSFGLWISANGWRSDKDVDEQLQALKTYDYPASVMVLEQWSDERTFYRWNDDGSWKNPAATVKRIRDAGLHLVLWQIPVVKYEWTGEWGEQLLQDEKEAIEKGYCVKNADGTPYRITELWFNNSLLPDFTNPEAVRWWFSKRKALLDMGVEGFKTDGGEFLFDDHARLYDGTRGLEAHNLYPVQYIGAYHAFLKENGVDGLTFSRAGFVGAQTQPMHWAGDQMSKWSELQSQLFAGLSAGLSGVLFWGFDIGGFAGELPSAELYLRATAMACFCPVMQWHAEPRDGQFYQSHEKGFNNDRSPWNLAEKLNAPELLPIAARFARIREKLRPYLVREARHCVAANRPMMAHLCLSYPHDARACETDDEYMLGRRLLVAPITKEGQTGRTVYLPRGAWEDAFTGARYAGGQAYDLSCDLTRALVFIRLSSLRGREGQDVHPQ